MASESVATTSSAAVSQETVATNPSMYGAAPVRGNFTDDEDIHLWCADALACVLAAPERPIDELNDDIQSALRYLLRLEISRARKAAKAERELRRAKKIAQAREGYGQEA